MRRILNAIMAICAVSVYVSAQGHARRPIEGVWKVAEIVVTGNGAATISKPQPGYIIFARKHVTMLYVPSDKERPAYAGASPTAEEKIAAFDSFIANAGTYELSGRTLTVRPTVARNPGFTRGGFVRYHVRIAGRTLWLNNKNSDFSFRVAGKIVPLSGPASETTIKLVRLE